MSKYFAFFDTKAGGNLFLLPSACALTYGLTCIGTSLEHVGMSLERGLVNLMSGQNSGQDHLARAPRVNLNLL